MTILNYDPSGFIVGMDRMNIGIDSVHDDTQEIIQILKGQRQVNDTRMRELTRAVRSVAQRVSAQGNVDTSRTRSSSSGSNRNTNNPPSSNPSSRITSNAPTRRTRTSNNQSSTDQGGSNQGGNANNRNRDDRGRFTSENGSSDTSGNRRRSSADRERDENGRFTGSAQSGSSGFGRGIGGSTNTSGIDPLIDSFNEAKDLLSPLTKGVGLIGRGAKMSISKLRSLKRREPLPDDQRRHNNENETLLDKIWKAILRSGSGGSGGRGMLGGLLGRLGLGAGAAAGAAGGGLLALLKKMGGVKGLGVIGSLIGAGSLAMDWGGLDHKGKSERVGQIGGGATGALIGGTLGSVVPVVGTAIGAVIGGWIGANGGEILGGAASPHIERWTQSLIRFNLADKMSSFWKDGVKPFFSSLAEMASGTDSWLADKWGAAKEGLGFGDGSGVSAGVTQKANKAADLITKNALTRSSGYCAKFVRKGLQEAGYDLKTQAHAYQYNNGALTEAGFSKVDPGKDGLQKGDVMVIPAEGKHKSGHIQMYNGTQWVSDFKQNSVNPWGDVATENLNGTMYRDQRGNKVGGNNSGKANQAMKYFTSQGWTKEQAAGIVGNLQKESQFDHTVDTGDGGKAYGIAQWHPDRQQDFKNKYGKSIKGSSFEEQLAFVQYELTKGDEQRAGNKLKTAKTAGQAGAVVSQFYERPRKVEAEKAERARLAEGISKGYTEAKVNQSKKSDGILGFGANAIGNNLTTSGNNFMPASSTIGISASNIAARPMLDFPKMAAITQRLDSGSSDKPIMVQSSNDTISQNVSDRGLAHAITGGIGKDRYFG